MPTFPDKKKSKTFALLGIGLIASFMGGIAFRKYHRSHQALITKLKQNSQTAVTANGVIEYAVIGEGIPILVSHGTIGGYDQGLAIIQPFLNQGFQFITVSRAGYLRSDAVTGMTPETQADTYAQLLDILDIPQAGIIGVSGGTPSALQFGLRHADRCFALVIMSGISKEAPLLPRMLAINIRLQAYTMRFDFPWWLLFKSALPVLLQANGVDNNLIQQIVRNQDLLALLRALYQPTATPSLRLKGTSIDDDQIQNLSPYPVETLPLPLLAIHSPTDPLVPMEQAIWLSETVQNGRLMTVADGGHPCFIIRREIVVPEVSNFFHEALL